MTAKRYRTKSIEVEAIQWNGKNHDEIYSFIGKDSLLLINGTAHIRTKDGVILAALWDFIVKGNSGEFYAFSQEIFKDNYDLISD